MSPGRGHFEPPNGHLTTREKLAWALVLIVSDLVTGLFIIWTR